MILRLSNNRIERELPKIKQQKQTEGKKHRVNCLLSKWICTTFSTNISLAKL
jgi:hypothetical protein